MGEFPISACASTWAAGRMCEGGEVFMVGGGGVRVVGALPIEGGQGCGNPVEVVAHGVDRLRREREVDEEDAFGAGVEARRNREDALRTVGARR